MKRTIAAAILAAVACNGDPVAPTLAACHTGLSPLVLSVGADMAVDPLPTSGCVIIPANASSTDSAEYLLVPQASTTGPDFRSSFKLAGGALIQSAPPVSAQMAASAPSLAQQFHDRLRLMEEEGTYPRPAGPAAHTGVAAPSVLAMGPSDTVGNPRTFKVLSNLSNSNFFASVNATAVSVGQHVIVYVDNLAPAPGLSTADYDRMRSDFDTLLYAVDVAAFGPESDVDGNGRVIVLMTNVVNSLVTATQCLSPTGGYVAGFFFAADIAITTRALWNNGEVFYTIVPDSSGTLSCPHPNSQVNRVVPTTFIHEFQHMISFNQHVLARNGSAEILWMNEGLSHYAEELGGRVFRQAGDSVRFCEFVRGDLYNFGLYTANPGGSALVGAAGLGGLAERGAYWAFLRYIVDQFAADTTVAAAATFTRQLTQTTSTGTDNVEARTGVQFATLAKRWVLANWVSDLAVPGFTVPNNLKYKTWKFRTAYPALHNSCSTALPASYPLEAPGLPGATINVSGTMYAGSAGTYQRALQGPGGAQVSFLFSDGTGALLKESVLPRLNVLRIR